MRRMHRQALKYILTSSSAKEQHNGCIYALAGSAPKGDLRCKPKSCILAHLCTVCKAHALCPLQTSAEAEAKQADIRSKHLQKQLAEQQKGLRAMEREAVKLQADLAKEEAAVQACQLRSSFRPLHALLESAPQ